MTDLAVFEKVTALAVLTDAAKYSEFYNKIKDEVSGHVADLSTVTGRAAVASLAYKVTRTKTAIDDAGKQLNAEARKTIDAVDAQRRKIRVELDALADEVRRPLTEWETAEDLRKQTAQNVLARLTYFASPLASASSEDLRADLFELEETQIDGEVHLEGTPAAILAKKTAIDALTAALERATKAEADAAELTRLRAEQQEREAQDFARAEEARLAAEAAAEQERGAAEAKRREDEQRAREERAAATAREEATRKAQAEHAAQLAKIERERKALEDAEQTRVAEVDRVAREEAARQKDRAHRGRLMGEAKAALIELGVAEDVAKKIVLAIVASEIPHVTLRF